MGNEFLIKTCQTVLRSCWGNGKIRDMVERGSLCPGTHEMSWETRGRHRYYFQTFTVEGRKVHKYVGKSPEAERQAALDELRYEERKAAQQADRDAKAQLESLEAPAASLFDLADLLGR